jgi:hypothetical protein
MQYMMARMSMKYCADVIAKFVNRAFTHTNKKQYMIEYFAPYEHMHEYFAPYEHMDKHIKALHVFTSRYLAEGCCWQRAKRTV